MFHVGTILALAELALKLGGKGAALWNQYSAVAQTAKDEGREYLTQEESDKLAALRKKAVKAYLEGGNKTGNDVVKRALGDVKAAGR